MNSRFYAIAVKCELLLNCLIGILPLFSSSSKTALQAKHKILILREDSIGDFVLFSCALEQYRKLYPNSHIVLLVASNVLDLAKDCPYVDEVWSMDVRRFRTSLVEKVRWLHQVRRARFDIAIHSVFSLGFEYIEPLVWWTRAARRIAHECVEMGRSRRLSPFYTELVPMEGSWKHELFRNHDMLRYLGYSGPPPLRPRLWLNEGTIDVDVRSPYGVVVPGSRYTMKDWPVNMFADAISKVNEDCSVYWIVLGGLSEQEKCAHLSQMLDLRGIAHLNLAGKTSLKQAAVILRSACVCFGNDSGLAHVALAQGVPVVTIVGGGHYGRFFPYPENVQQYVVSKKMDCYFCSWKCVYDSTRCIEEVTVDMVTSALRSALSQASSVANERYNS